MAGNYLHELKSRSRKKREAHDATDLGARLAALGPGQLRGLELPDELLAALLEVRRLGGSRRGGAQQRQLRFVGGLLRELDADVLARLESLLGEEDDRKRQGNEAFQRLEEWRDALVAGGETVLEEIRRRFPQADLAALRDTALKARAEAELGKPPKHARQIFRYLRHLEQDLQDDGAE